MRKRTRPSSGVMTRNTSASSGFMVNEKNTPRAHMTGALTSGLSPLLTAFCMTVTSLVSRVTSDEVSYLSMFEKAYDWIAAYSARLMLAPQP